jgi:hypothetical protein
MEKVLFLFWSATRREGTFVKCTPRTLVSVISLLPRWRCLHPTLPPRSAPTLPSHQAAMHTIRSARGCLAAKLHCFPAAGRLSLLLRSSVDSRCVASLLVRVRSTVVTKQLCCLSLLQRSCVCCAAASSRRRVAAPTFRRSAATIPSDERSEERGPGGRILDMAEGVCRHRRRAAQPAAICAPS